MAKLLEDSTEGITIENKDGKRTVKAGRLVRLVECLAALDVQGRSE